MSAHVARFCLLFCELVWLANYIRMINTNIEGITPLLVISWCTGPVLRSVWKYTPSLNPLYVVNAQCILIYICIQRVNFVIYNKLKCIIQYQYRIQHGAFGPLYVTSSYSTWIFCRGVSGFATDCPCDIWCRGLTTCLLHVGPPFGNRLLNNSWAVGLT